MEALNTYSKMMTGMKKSNTQGLFDTLKSYRKTYSFIKMISSGINLPKETTLSIRFNIPPIGELLQHI